MEDKENVKTFMDLNVWKEGHELVMRGYVITKNFPKEEMYGLSSQLRRALISITSNIAEGFGRPSYKEKLRFYYISKGSLLETQNQLIVAKDLNYLSKEDFDKINNKLIIVHKMLNAFITKTKTFI
ncbi:MAG: four helix bundle protein [bacterium]|nr:four helix bundle protein [bacterium]